MQTERRYSRNWNPAYVPTAHMTGTRNQKQYRIRIREMAAWKKDQARIALLKHEFLLCQAHRYKHIYTWPY